jgi:hypothetical protein
MKEREIEEWRYTVPGKKKKKKSHFCVFFHDLSLSYYLAIFHKYYKMKEHHLQNERTMLIMAVHNYFTLVCT